MCLDSKMSCELKLLGSIVMNLAYTSKLSRGCLREISYSDAYIRIPNEGTEGNCVA